MFPTEHMSVTFIGWQPPLTEQTQRAHFSGLIRFDVNVVQDYELCSCNDEEKKRQKHPASEFLIPGKTFTLGRYSPSRGNFSFCWHLVYVSRCGTAQTNMRESDKSSQVDFSCVKLRNEFRTNRHASRGCGAAEVSPSLQTKIKN